MGENEPITEARRRAIDYYNGLNEQEKKDLCRRYELNTGEMDMLVSMYDAAETGISATDARRIGGGRLERIYLIEFYIDKKDRRKRGFEFTEKGKKKVEDALDYIVRNHLRR